MTGSPEPHTAETPEEVHNRNRILTLSGRRASPAPAHRFERQGEAMAH